MGINPVPEVPGDDCICWPAGQTPNLVKVFFSGIEKGGKWVDTLPGPPNGYHDVPQSPGTPCEFFVGGPAIYRVKYQSSFGFPALANLWCQVAAGPYCFTIDPTASCSRSFANAQINFANEWYIKGSAYITTPAEMQAMIELATPITGPEPKMELFPMEDGEIVVKFCNIEDGTNIKIKIDTALL